MKQIIIIETSQTQKLKKFLDQEHFDYQIYQRSEQNQKSQEKLALREWQNLTDEELINEWEQVND